MNIISIFIIDDHKLFVEGLCSLLSEVPGFKIAGYSLNPLRFLEEVECTDPSIYLIDINMPQLSGVELTMKLKQKKNHARILALTMYDEYEYVEKMIKAGANGYILKSASLQELTKAIETVSCGNRFLGSDIQEMFFNKVGKSQSFSNNKDRFEEEATLTKREIEILVLIAKELTTQQIADSLFISERTVETHRKNIFSKVKAKTVIGLSRYAQKHGFINEL
jgi:DNA-binding NarL/FixJ family response regulator